MDGGVSSALTWAELGVATEILSTDGTIPEPGSACLLILGFVLLFGKPRRLN